MPVKIVIIGGGASGVFTAYLLQKQAPGEFDIKILEQREQLGGHAHSVVNTVAPEQVSIDYGAQFFSETAQPLYCEMLREEGLFDVPGLIRQFEAGVSIWDATQQKLNFRIPDSILGILLDVIDPNKVVSWICFVEMTLQAKLLYEQGDWSVTFGDWIESIVFPGVSSADADAFKRDVMRPLMYQFGLVDPPDLDALSARFVVFYFLGSLPKGLEAAAFTVYNSMEGLDGILERLRDLYGLTASVETGKTVDSLEEDGGGWTITTTDGSTYQADEVVFATNPMQVLSILPETAAYTGVRAVLGDLGFVDVLIRIQHPTPAYMPADPADWSVSNVTVADTDPISPGPTHYMLSVWFGPLRDETIGAQFFKSWGSPSLVPDVALAHHEHFHQLMVGTPLFMARRQELRALHQGVHSLWYVGGWSIDYDSQNAALRSANLAVGQIAQKYGVPLAEPRFLMLGSELEALSGGAGMLGDPALPAQFPLIEAIRGEISTRLSDHPAVLKWTGAVKGR